MAIQQHAFAFQQPNFAVQQPTVALQQPTVAVQEHGLAFQQPALALQQSGVALEQPAFSTFSANGQFEQQNALFSAEFQHQAQTLASQNAAIVKHAQAVPAGTW